jgi:hypothetical protein
LLPRDRVNEGISDGESAAGDRTPLVPREIVGALAYQPALRAAPLPESRNWAKACC